MKSRICIVVSALVLVSTLWAPALIHIAASTTPRGEKPTRETLARGNDDLEFATRSLQALTSAETPAVARWREVARTHQTAMLQVITRAQKQGWKATSMTSHQSKGLAPGAGRLASIAQDLGVQAGNGEMLIWNWDDGNPNTAEGTIWVHSYSTGNEILFNVQITGPTYNDTEVSFFDTVYAVFHSPINVAFRGTPSASPQLRLVGQRERCASVERRCEVEMEWMKKNRCNSTVLDRGAMCMGRQMRGTLREGLRSAAMSAGAGAIGGAMEGGLVGALGGAVVAAGPGFAAGILYDMVWGTDQDCGGEAIAVYSECMSLPMDEAVMNSCIWSHGGCTP